MDATEFLSILEMNPNDITRIEKEIQSVLEQGGEHALSSLLENLVSIIDKKEYAEGLIRALESLYKKVKDTPQGQIVAWNIGVLYWKNLKDLGKAETFMKLIPEGATHFNEWCNFYRAFYASRGNWLRLEQFFQDLVQRNLLSQVESKRLLAQTAFEFQNQQKELSYWQALVQITPNDEEANDSLERLYFALQRWPSLAEHLLKRAQSMPAGAIEEKVNLLYKVIEIYQDKMKAEPKVLSTYSMILEIDPKNMKAIDALLERYEAAGRWPDYIKTLQRKIENTTDVQEIIRLRERQAELMETKFANALEAQKAYEEILNLAPQRRDIREKLKSLYDKRRDYDNLIRIRLIEAEEITDPISKAALLIELANIATERLRKIPIAIELWEQVLAIDEKNEDALKNLEQLYEREKDLVKLCDILNKRVKLAKRDDERIALLEKLAVIYGTKLSDNLSALETWKQILQIQPNHERAKRELRTRFLTEHKWDDLEVFLRRFGTVEELARTLEAQVGSITDQEEKRGVLYKLAGIWRDELGQPARAIKDLEGVLAFDPHDLRAAMELIPLYKAVGDFRRLPEVYDVAISKTTERDMRLKLLVEAAEVHEKQLRDLDRAFFLYLDAFKEDMLSVRLQQELERLAEPSNNWEIYVDVLEQSADFMPSVERQVTTYLRVGQIHREKLNSPQQALKAFRKALQLDKENQIAISALEEIYRETCDYESLVEILNLRLGLETKWENRKAIISEIGSTLYHKMGRVQEAIDKYKEIIEQEPDDFKTYHELSELYLAEKRFGDLLELLRKQADVLETQRFGDPLVLADIYCRIGLLIWGLNGPCKEVVDAWAKSLSLVPLHERTLELLPSCLGVKELRLQVVSLLRPAYQELNKNNELADLTEIEILERGVGKETLDLLWELQGRYSDIIKDNHKTFRTLTRILNITPDDKKAWEMLEETARQIAEEKTWNILTEEYEKVSGFLSLADAIELKMRLGNIYISELSSLEKAKTTYEDIVRSLIPEDMEDERLEEKLRDIHTDNQRLYPALMLSLYKLEEIYDLLGAPPEKKEHALKMQFYGYRVSYNFQEAIKAAYKAAEVRHKALRDVGGAITWVNRILEMSPDDPKAYAELDLLYTEAEDWVSLETVLQQRIRLAQESIPERIEYQLRLSRLREEMLGDLSGAVEVYRHILESDPGNQPAISALARLFTNSDIRVMVAHVLRPAYHHIQDYEKLLEVYDVLAQAEETNLEQRLEYYDICARICEENLLDYDRAFAYRARAFGEAPERENLMEEVLRVGRLRNNVMEAVFVLCEKVGEISDESRRMETHRRIANVCMDEVADREMAKQHFNWVLSINPSDIDALDSLAKMYREDDEVEPLSEIILRKAEITLDTSEKIYLLLDAGALFANRLDKKDKAISAYNSALELDPSNKDAIESLENLYEKDGNWTELTEILSRKATFAEKIEDKISALKKKGAVQAEKLGDTLSAIETFLEVHNIQADDVECLKWLDRLYASTEDWYNLYGVLEKLKPLVFGEERLTIHYRMGRLLETSLSDPIRAVQTYAEIVSEYPDNREAIDALEDMVSRGEAQEEAFAILEPVLSQRGEWKRLSKVYEVIIEREEDPIRKVARLLTVGDIEANQIHDYDHAFECYGRAFTTDPRNQEALTKLEALAEQEGLWSFVPDLLLEGAKVIEGTPEALSLRLRSARILRDKLNEKERAVEAYAGVISDFPDNKEALCALDTLYEELEKWEALSKILALEVEASEDIEEKIRFLLRLGDILEEKLNNTVEALNARREVLYLQPTHDGAVRALRGMFDRKHHQKEILGILEPVYTETQAWLELATMYESVIPAIEDLSERKEILIRLAEVCVNRLDAKVDALVWFGKALAIEPDDDALLSQVETLAQETGEYGKLEDILLDAAQAAESDERRVYLWHKAAEYVRDYIGKPDKAESIYRWILDVQPNDMKALSALDKMYESQQRYHDLLKILERECESSDWDEDKVIFLMRAGRLQREKLDDIEGAIDSFQAVLKMNETHKEALIALSELYTIREEYESLFKVLSILADISETPTDRVAILRRMAKIAEDNLGKKDEALSQWEEVSRIMPEDVGVLQELQRLYAEKQDWTAFIDTCEREIGLVKGDIGRVTYLLRQIAKSAEEFLSDAYLAQQAWKRVLEISPYDIEAMQNLRRLYRESQDFESLSDILERLAQSGSFVGGELFELLLEHARLLTESLPRPEEAIKKWNQLLIISPNYIEALSSLQSLYESIGRIPDCVEVIKRQAGITEDIREKANLLLHAADLLADRWKDLTGATATLEELLTIDPTNLEAFERLHSLYTRLENWDNLADAMLRKDGVLTTVEDRVMNFTELARIYEQKKGDPLAAFYVLCKCAAISPGDENVLMEIWRITNTLENYVEYVEELSPVVDKMPEPLMQEHLIRFGECLWKKAGKAEEAIPYYERVLQRWPEDMSALTALTDLYAGSSRWEKLIDVLTKRVEITPDYTEKTYLQLWVGKVLETEIKSSERALSAYQKVLEFDDTNLDALNALSRLYEKRKEWEELLKVLDVLAPLTKEKEVEIRLKMAEILETKVKDPERAIHAYEEVLNIEPTNSTALDRLQALYGQLDNWKGLADVYERLLDLATSDPDRILFCHNLGMVWETALGDKKKALEYYQRILDMDPTDEEVFETCARLLTEVEDWYELVNLLENKITRVTDVSQKVQLLQRVADVYETKIGDINSAIATHQRILEVDDASLSSYKKLADLFSQMELWEDVVQTLLKWKDHVEGDEFSQLMLSAASILKEKLYRPERAIILLNNILTNDPRNEEAAERLRTIYAEMEDWEKVAEVYLRQEKYADTDERRAKMIAAAGDIYMHKLKDRLRAISYLEKALELNPKIQHVTMTLASAYVSAEKWEKAEPLLELLLNAVDVTHEPEQAAEIHYLTGLCSENLMDYEKAFREYQAAARLRPNHLNTILGLARLYQRKGLWQLSKDHYLRVLKEEGALEQQELARVYFALGEVNLKLELFEEAQEYLEKAHQIDMKNLKTIELLGVVAQKRGDWPSFIRSKQALMEVKADRFEQFAILLEIAEIYKSKMGNIFGAVKSCKDALALVPDHKVALKKLFEIYLENGQYEDALYIQEKLATLEEKPEKKALHYMGIGALYAEKLGDDVRAIDYYNRALDTDPDNLEAFRAIDELLTKARDWESQAANYRKMIERVKGRGMPDLEHRLYFNLGEVYRSRLKRYDLAIPAFAMAAKLRPEERRTHEILAQLYEVTQDQKDKAVEEYRAIVSVNPLSPESASSYKAMRRLFLEMKEFDKAWITAGVLTALSLQDAEELEFFESNLDPALPWFKGTLDPLRWESHLLSKSEDTIMGRILQVLYIGLGSELGVKDFKDVGIKKKNELDLNLKLLFVNVYKAVAKALGGIPHKVYRDDASIGLKIEFLVPPALIVGADMFTGHEEREVAFKIGRQLTYFHPMHFLTAVKNLTELKVYLAAVLKFAEPGTQIASGSEIVAELVRLIERRMPQQQKNQLVKLVSELHNKYPEMDLNAIYDNLFKGIEKTSIRVGMLVCGNVVTAYNILRGEDISFSGLSHKEKLEELISFAISEDHFILRKTLGIALESEVNI